MLQNTGCEDLICQGFLVGGQAIAGAGLGQAGAPQTEECGSDYQQVFLHDGSWAAASLRRR